MRLKRLAGLLCLISCFALVTSASAAPDQTIRVIVFPGGFNWPLWVAQEKGFASKRGLAIDLTETRNSVEQMRGLVDGRFDLAMTAFDNVVAYHEGETNGGSGAGAPIAAVMGGDNGFLALVAQPNYGAVADLRGQKLAVDALTTGYAFVLQEMLHRAGFTKDDYSLVSAGGVKQRFEGLVGKSFAATLLISPFDEMATRRGLRRLATADDLLGHYQGVTAAVRTDWASNHRGEVTGYISAYRRALDWLYDPGNREEAITIFLRHAPGSTPSEAAAAYAVLIDCQKGLQPEAALDAEGMRMVLALRKQYGPSATLGPPSRYVALQYFDRVARTSSTDGSVGGSSARCPSSPPPKAP
jgi:ABC-type nitrate/sulfonate/bicarbonate transport system substrate-binding protein